MLKLLSLTIFLLFLTIFCHGQGSWNIGYIKVDSINRNNLGQLVRPDFKSNNSGTKSDRQRHIRSYVGTKDTATVTIDTTLFKLAERRKIYPDHGSYSDQYLECINCKQGTVFIYDAKIIDLNEDSIQFEIHMETKRANQVIKRETKILRIERSKLDGLMYRR